MKSVKHILQRKNSAIYSISAESSVLEALKLMMEKNISALLIIENEELKGIFTERDYARKIVLQGKSSKETAIKEVMTPTLLTIGLADTIDLCMEIMTDKHIRHLPVIENGKVAGMISIGDAVKFVIEEQKRTIEQLENYINS
ncbi:MAG: CBS domain-containing protein [Daejeonella sp.]